MTLDEQELTRRMHEAITAFAESHPGCAGFSYRIEVCAEEGKETYIYTSDEPQ